MLTNRLPTIIAELDVSCGDAHSYAVTVLHPLGASKCESIVANCAEDAIEKMARMEGIDDYAFKVRS